MELDSTAQDMLKELGNIGTGNAITALSAMLGKEIVMECPQVRVVGFNEVPDTLGGMEAIRVGVLVRDRLWLVSLPRPEECLLRQVQHWPVLPVLQVSQWQPLAASVLDLPLSGKTAMASGKVSQISGTRLRRYSRMV